MRVAAAVADDDAVDWDAERATLRESVRELRRLQLIQEVSRAHHRMHSAVQLVTTSNPDPVADVDDAPAPMNRWGDLEIIELCGSGAFGEVYRASDPRLERDVALKLLRPTRNENRAAEERFLEEGRKLAKVSHNNMVTVHGAARHDGRIGIWTEMIDGRTLEQELKRQGRRSERDALHIGTDVCGALAALHAAGIVHRDVKTDNIMREDDGGRIVLLDLSSAAGLHPERNTDVVNGTPLYMAPEVLNGATAGVRADIYSLGVVLYRLVSGQFPVEVESVRELIESADSLPIVPLRELRPELSQGFVDVVEKAMHPDPERRFRSASEMEQALHRLTRTRILPAWAGWTAAAAVLVVAAGIVGVPLLMPPPLQATATLLRASDAGNEILPSGATIAGGDELLLELTTNREAYVYVVNRDSAGKLITMFPTPESQLQNPLPPDTTHELPGGDSLGFHTWTVSSSSGQDTIMVLASAKRIVDLEAALADLPYSTAVQSSGDSASSAWSPTLRGIGGVSRRERVATSTTLTLMRPPVGKDLNRWEWTLSNPPSTDHLTPGNERPTEKPGEDVDRD